MIDIVLRDPATGKPLWIDVVSPTEAEYEQIAADYSLHPTFIADSMEPFHLPKHAKSGDSTFLLLRAFDESSALDAATVQAMTRKLALFIGDRFLISVHSQPQPFIDEIKADYRARAKDAEVFLQVVLLELTLAAIDTYDVPIERAEKELEGFEGRLFAQESMRWTAEQIYETKARLLVIRRMLWHMLHATQRFLPHSESNLPLWQEVKERVESQQFFVDSLLDDLESLLAVQLSLASQRASEVMRVLTIYSAFFMPLTFIVGVWGMNFRVMPELGWEYGYLLAWGVILAAAGAVYLWFRRQGWMK